MKVRVQMDRDSVTRLREEHEHYFTLMRLATDRRLQDHYAVLANKARRKLGALEASDRQRWALSLAHYFHVAFATARAKLSHPC